MNSLYWIFIIAFVETQLSHSVWKAIKWTDIKGIMGIEMALYVFSKLWKLFSPYVLPYNLYIHLFKTPHVLHCNYSVCVCVVCVFCFSPSLTEAIKYLYCIHRAWLVIVVWITWLHFKNMAFSSTSISEVTSNQQHPTLPPERDGHGMSRNKDIQAVFYIVDSQ